MICYRSYIIDLRRPNNMFLHYYSDEDIYIVKGLNFNKRYYI